MSEQVRVNWRELHDEAVRENVQLERRVAEMTRALELARSHLRDLPRSATAETIDQLCKAALASSDTAGDGERK